METCKKCGAHIEEEVFCPVCGARVKKIDVKEKVTKAAKDAAERGSKTMYISPSDINKNKGFAVISYLWFLFLVPIFGAKKSNYAKFHANQGLLLFIAEMIVIIITGICVNIPLLGGIIEIASTLISLVFFIFRILGIVNALKGRVKPLPLIGRFMLLK